MGALATFSANGFQVVANNAVDYIAGTQAASAGMVSANIRQMSDVLHADLQQVTSAVITQGAKVANVNQQGFDAVNRALGDGFTSIQALSGASLAVQAAGFAVVAGQLHGLRGDVKQLGADLTAQGEQLIALQTVANARLETLADFAGRTLETQDKILAALSTSRTVEANQLVQQALDNVEHGYTDEARERLGRALEMDNTLFAAHAELARLDEADGDQAKAEDHFRRACNFAPKDSPELQGFAHLQMAAFYERTGSLDRALGELDAALACVRRAEWMLYRVELLARVGRSDAALSESRATIELDRRMFVAVMASAALEPLQPDLTRMLLELDGNARGQVLEPLQEVCSGIAVAEAVGVPEERVRDLRNQGSSVLTTALAAPFADLPPLQEEAQSLRSSVSDAIDNRVGTMVQQLKAERSRTTQVFESCPSQKEPGKVATRSLGLAISIAIGAFSILVWFLAMVVLTKDVRLGLFLWAVAGGTAAGAVLWARQTLSNSPSAMKLRREWNQWSAQAADASSRWSESADACRNMFERGTAAGGHPSLSAVAEHLTVEAPQAPEVPGWVSEPVVPSPAQSEGAAPGSRGSEHAQGGQSPGSSNDDQQGGRWILGGTIAAAAIVVAGAALWADRGDPEPDEARPTRAVWVPKNPAPVAVSDDTAAVDEPSEPAPTEDVEVARLDEEVSPPPADPPPALPPDEASPDNQAAPTPTVQAGNADNALPTWKRCDSWQECNEVGFDLYQSEQYEQAAKVFKRAHRLAPREPVPLYNVACMYGKLGDALRAVRYLERLAKLDDRRAQRRVQKARRDSDFAAIREHPRFVAFIEAH